MASIDYIIDDNTLLVINKDNIIIRSSIDTVYEQLAVFFLKHYYKYNDYLIGITNYLYNKIIFIRNKNMYLLNILNDDSFKNCRLFIDENKHVVFKTKKYTYNFTIDVYINNTTNMVNDIKLIQIF